MPETNFFWDPLSDNILQERDEGGVVTAEYTTEPGQFGNLISQNRQGVESQYHFDALGATLALTDDSQQVTDTYAYSAFGEVTERTGSTVALLQYVGQKGYYRDDVTSEYAVRDRPFAPEQGRWLSEEHDWHLVALHSITYAVNNPVGRADPAGAQPAPLPPTGPTCEIWVLCRKAFGNPLPAYHCEFALSHSDWSFSYTCRCSGWHLCSTPANIKKCTNAIWIPPSKWIGESGLFGTCPNTGYVIPIGVPACVGCSWEGVHDYHKNKGEWTYSHNKVPSHICDCIRKACIEFPHSLCYFPVFSANSNTGFGCVWKKCKLNTFGVTLPAILTWDNVPGWDHGCPAGFIPGVPGIN